MFDAPLSARRRPMFGVSAALHAALGLALVVPPLFATQEPPDPEIRMLPFYPVASVSIGNERARAPVDLLRKGNGGRAASPASRASDKPRSGSDLLAQPREVAELLPAPTGEDSRLPFEAPGERSEPGSSGSGGGDGAGGDGRGGCEGCSPVSATAPGVTAPVPLETVSPTYPELARRAHIEGIVVLEAIIGADGRVRDARVLRSASPLLDPAALDAVRRWRYRAATVEGRGVPVYLTVVVTFSLR